MLVPVDDKGQAWLSNGNPYQWNAVTSLPTQHEDWASIAMSEDGQYIVVGSNLYDPDANGNIYLSPNYGGNWTETSAPTSQVYSALAMDSSG